MSKSKFESKFSGAGPSFQPLYQQVKERLTQYIVEQRWKPGEVLPNEFRLADELGVSQGTVRKALNRLTEQGVLVRRQGVGTFVSEHTGQSALYRFFPLVADGQPPELPTSEVLSLEYMVASEEVAEALNLQSGEGVICMRRRRFLGGECCLLETIYLPEEFFPNFPCADKIPHTLYHFYQTDYRLTVDKTLDRIKAVSCSEQDAKLMGIEPYQPLLHFTRVAESLNGEKIEYRISRCRSDHFHYLVDLT